MFMTVFIMFLSRLDSQIDSLALLWVNSAHRRVIQPGLSWEGSGREGVDVFAMAFPRALWD